MRAESFISGRLSFKGRAAVISIAVSFLVMIIALSVSGGFRSSIRSGLAQVIGDIRITRAPGQESQPFTPDDSLRSAIAAIPGVDSVKPVIYSSGIVRSGDTIHGAVFKGVETDDPSSFNVRIPSRLSSMLGLEKGDKMLTWFVGNTIVLRNFVVEDIYDAVTTGDDKMIIFCDLHTLQRVNRWEEGEVTALEILLDDDYRQDSKSLLINTRISNILYNLKDGDLLVSNRTRAVYSQIFDWLNLIDFNVFFILVLMTIVAGLNMVSGLLILLFENISTIGLLKSMGMQVKGIAATFLRVSSTLVLRGMLWGNAAGIGLCYLQSLTHIIRLDPDNYFVSFLPMKIDLVSIAVIDAIAFVAILLIMLIPCSFISKVDPAQSMREK